MDGADRDADVRATEFFASDVDNQPVQKERGTVATLTFAGEVITLPVSDVDRRSLSRTYVLVAALADLADADANTWVLQKRAFHEIAEEA